MKKKPTILLTLLVAPALAVGSWLLFRSERVDHRGMVGPAAGLRQIAVAEADFRANDRDRNGKNDYWRADVAGLFTVIPRGDTPELTNAIKLIEVSVAGADDRPKSDINRFIRPSPKAGYWFRAIRHAEEKELDSNRFAFCAFPNSPSSGRWTYIIDEENTMYRRDLGEARGIEVYPDKEQLKRLWTRID